MFTNQKRRRKAEKTQLRKLIEKKTTKLVKKDILVSIQQIIPSLLSPLLRYLSNNGKRGCVCSKREISKIN